MSYCRWSSMDFQCDLYVNEFDDGVSVNVAGRRYVFGESLPELALLIPGFTEDEFRRWCGRREQMSALIDPAELRPIGLSRDGESFYYGLTFGKAADLCESLIAEGYRAPTNLVADLRDEPSVQDAELSASPR